MREWLSFQRPPMTRVEAIESDQADNLSAIHEKSFAHGWSTSEFERLLSDRNTVCDGLFIGKSRTPSGFIMSRRVLDEAEILSIAIDPKARLRGFSHALLQHHLEELARFGIRTLHLEVDENNTAALALYRRAKFEITGRRRGYYAQPDGSRTTALTMSLVL